MSTEKRSINISASGKLENWRNLEHRLKKNTFPGESPVYV